MTWLALTLNAPITTKVICYSGLLKCLRSLLADSVDPDQTASIGAVCSGSMLFASILNSSVMLGNYLQQTTSADNIFRCIFFLALLGLIPSTHLWKKGYWVYTNDSQMEKFTNIIDPDEIPENVTSQWYLLIAQNKHSYHGWVVQNWQNVTRFPRSGKSQWKMKKVQGQGKVREFRVESGKFEILEEVRKSQGTLYEIVIFLNVETISGMANC